MSPEDEDARYVIRAIARSHGQPRAHGALLEEADEVKTAAALPFSAPADDLGSLLAQLDPADRLAIESAASAEAALRAAEEDYRTLTGREVQSA